MPPSGPIIWSETRQELCESLAYYRAYQTGSYVSSNSSTPSRPPSSALLKSDRRSHTLKDSIPYGYLLAGWPSRRDAFAQNGRVIISHGGGKSQVVTPTNPAAGPSEPRKASLKQDQSSSDSSIIRALLHSARHKLPIVLIAAENYALLPWKLDCGYAVLGWYVITDAWAEREVKGDGDGAEGEGEGFVRCKFRFEWIEAQGEPWWELQSKDTEEDWNPRSRVEMFSKAQRRMANQMKGKKTTLKETSPSSSRSISAVSSRSSSVPASRASTPKPMSEEERDQLLFGPLPTATIPTLISTTTTTLDSETPSTLTRSATCLACRHASPHAFSLGWMCLEPSCTRFFLLTSGLPPSESSLEFDPSFLLPLGPVLNTSFPSNEPPFPLIPRKPSFKTMDQAQGLWCKHCGRLSCREVIFQPRCAHCHLPVGKWKPLPTVQSPQLSRGILDFSSKAEGVFDPVISPSSGIKLEVRRVVEGGGGSVVYSFRFPAMFGDCAVHLVQADTEGGVVKEEEADEILREFQKFTWPENEAEEEKGYEGQREGKRRKIDHSPIPSADNIPMENRSQPSSSSSPSNSTLTNTTPATTPDTQSTHPKETLIPFRRHTLKSHGGGPGRMLTQQFTCNYGVPYKHIVAMGTQPLSPTTSPPPILSTLSLLHRRTSFSLSSSNPKESFSGFNELYPVLYLTHQKMSYHDDGEPGLGPIISSLSLGSTCRMKFRLKSKHLASFPSIKPRDKVVLDLPLRHGSVVVQQGEDLQKYFEHCVNPDGFRIAVTGRWIDQSVNDKTSSRGGGKRKIGAETNGRRSSSPKKGRDALESKAGPSNSTSKGGKRKNDSEIKERKRSAKKAK